MNKVRAAIVAALIAALLIGLAASQLLPLVFERPADRPGETIALIVTGDGGWAAIDRAIATELNKKGISVVGLSSLRYFWQARTPEAAADDVARILRAYLIRWNARRIVMIGYSRGADVMPFIVNRLPADLQARIVLVALLGLEPTVGFELRPWDAIRGEDRRSDLLVAPEARKLDPTRVLCVAGTEEADSLCPELETLGAETAVFQGGHHFGGRYREVGQAIVAAMRARQP